MNLLLILITASLISFLLYPIVITLANKYKFVDDPKTHNHPAILHTKTLPRAGGVALFVGFLIAILIFVPIEKHLLGLLIASLLVVVVGTLDDRYDIHPAIRLISGFVAASIVVISGVGISSIDIPFLGSINLNSIDIPIYLWGEHHFFPLADISAVIWIMAIMNFVNWSTGVDGQLPIISIVSFAFMALLAFQFISYDPSQWTIIKISLAIIGATLPLLIFNWHPAQIIPGYGASTFIGFIIAVLAIYSGSKTATAILILGVPVIDGLWTIGRRVYQGKMPIWGDRQHLHHKLLHIGWSHAHVASFYGIVTFILGLIAIYSSKVTKVWAIIGTALFLLGITTILGISSKKKSSSKN